MIYAALRTSGTSADVIRDVLALHLPGGGTVLDLTYGMGTFWRWDHAAAGIMLTTNDRYVPGCDRDWDFTDLPDHAEWHWFDAVIFDPPFTANGPSKEGHQKRYGADRSMPGAPQSIKDVHRLLRDGIREACAVARHLVIVKTQPVVESGHYHDSQWVATDAIHEAGWKIADAVWFLKGRRPQPDAQRGATVRHFRDRPSVFLIARRLA